LIVAISKLTLFFYILKISELAEQMTTSAAPWKRILLIIKAFPLITNLSRLHPTSAAFMNFLVAFIRQVDPSYSEDAARVRGK
jgi:hypothetical protein